MTDDHSRVVLEKIEGDPKSDYINASYIPVSTTPHRVVRSILKVRHDISIIIIEQFSIDNRE